MFDAAGSDKPVARVTVEPILGGCGMLETYADAHGHAGRSFSLYDASRRLWHQTWITNEGQLLVIEGGLQGGRMELAGTDRARFGAPARRVRGTWQPQADAVREVGLRSLDEGRTWQPWFDLLFRRHVAR